MAYNIFISCDSKDTDLARDLSKRLEKAGATVTLSTHKMDKPDGVKERVESMTKADEIICLVTKNSIDGKRLLFDMGVATTMRKRLTSVILGLKPKDLPDIMRNLEFIKYEDLERYISRLRRMVDDASKQSAKAQPKSGEPSKSAA